MQLHKYYGRTISGAVAQVKRELGSEAMILETNTIEPGSAAARMNPGARYEILAARDGTAVKRPGAPAAKAEQPEPAARGARTWDAPQRGRESREPRTQTPAAHEKPQPPLWDPAASPVSAQAQARIQSYAQAQGQSRTSALVPSRAAVQPQTQPKLQPKPLPRIQPEPELEDWPEPQTRSRIQTKTTVEVPPPAPPARGRTVLEDLGLLRAQIHQLLDGDLDGGAGEAQQDGRLDLSDYHALIEQGVNHQVLAPHFRLWLEWRTAAPVVRRYLAQVQGGPAARMQAEGLREWLWWAWSEDQGLLPEAKGSDLADGRHGPKIVSLVGPTGGGKTTTLAKLASINRHKRRQNAVIVTLDAQRFGATEQWRRYAKLMDIPVTEIVSSEDLSESMENWGRLDWIGIDTPGGMTLESEAGRRYGSILARCPNIESILVLPATQQESVSREQMKRSRSLKAAKVLFSKLDETLFTGGIVNLTMDGEWKIDSFTMGSRVPQDWEAVSHEALWERVLAPQRDGLTYGGAQ